MKQYIRSRIIICIEIIVIFAVILLIRKETYNVSTLSVVMNDSLEKSLDVEVIQQNQKEFMGLDEEMTDQHEKSFGVSDGCVLIAGLWLQRT